MKVGAHSWLLETRYPLPQAMIEARRIGYDGYEVDIGNFGGTGLGLQILPDRMQDEHRDDIRRSAAEAEYRNQLAGARRLVALPLHESRRGLQQARSGDRSGGDPVGANSGRSLHPSSDRTARGT